MEDGLAEAEALDHVLVEDPGEGGLRGAVDAVDAEVRLLLDRYLAPEAEPANGGRP